MPEKPKYNLNAYARYSGMAFQMLVVILAGVFGGYFLDRWANTKPVFTVILSILGVFLAIYYVTKDLLRNKK